MKNRARPPTGNDRVFNAFGGGEVPGECAKETLPALQKHPRGI